MESYELKYGSHNSYGFWFQVKEVSQSKYFVCLPIKQGRIKAPNYLAKNNKLIEGSKKTSLYRWDMILVLIVCQKHGGKKGKKSTTKMSIVRCTVYCTLLVVIHRKNLVKYIIDTIEEYLAVSPQRKFKKCNAEKWYFSITILQRSNSVWSYLETAYFFSSNNVKYL